MKNYKYELFFVKPEYLKEEVLKNFVWDDIDVEKEPIKAYNFKGVTTLSKENPHVSLFKQYGEKFTFSSIEEILAFYKDLEQFSLGTMMTNRLKDSYLILVAEGLPPLHLIERVTGIKSGFLFYLAGEEVQAQINQLLKQYSRYNVEKLLDWGCGCGRSSNHFIHQKNIECIGCDIDKEAIDWCKNNLDGTFYATALHPPLPFEDASFTSVIGISVMTHLTEYYQQIWLKEMHRVLKNDGLLFLSVHGKPAFIRDGLESNLNETGFYDAIVDNGLGDIVPKDYYRATFQTPKYTYQNWTKYFDILEYNEQAISNHQDLVVLRKKKVRKWFQF